MATKAELQEALDKANADRSPEDQIVPDGANKGDLEAALTAAGIDLPEGAPPAAKKKGLQVTAPLVQVAIGPAVMQFRQGDILPDGVSDESVAHLKSLGYVGEVDAPEADTK